MTSIAFLEDFDGSALDLEVWVPHYLPQWSSRAESAATYEVGGSELRLTIPPGQGVWCEGDHEPPLRVSGVQSGVFSGAGRVHGWAAAVSGWADGARGAAGSLGLDSSPRADRGAGAHGAQPAVDGVRVDGRARSRSRSSRARSASSRSSVTHRQRRVRHQAVPRSVAHGEFDAPRMEIDVAEPHVYGVGLARGPRRVLRRRRAGEVGRAGARLPPADDGRRRSTSPRSRARPTTCRCWPWTT